MPFIVDQQTQQDLTLHGKFRSNSMFSLFNRVKTRGGERLLEKMFREPLTNAKEINERSRCIRYLQQKKVFLPFEEDVFDKADQFLSRSISKHLPGAYLNAIGKRISSTLINDEDYAEFTDGLNASFTLLRQMKGYLNGFDAPAQSPLAKELTAISELLHHHRLEEVINLTTTSYTTFELARYGYLLTTELRSQLESLLDIIYRLDVYSAAALVAAEHNFCYAVATTDEQNIIDIQQLWYPGLKNAVPNTISFSSEKNILFLTGANMAGKSTIMKAFGLAVFLAHMGFPVAASQMYFTPKDGLYTSINVPDNLKLGHSHYYAEVQRVKTVAEHISSGKKMIVIFDELFKGTNVKDAYEATLTITMAFAGHDKSAFIISTHITEVGDILKEKCLQVAFAFMPTILTGHLPRYPYTLMEGISNDRHGMVIIRNEGIIELLS